ncbi:hypothetical protein D3879_22425 [Pseudomonas cavernicola]|uniref:Uncharacterized protein n=1 Tax=Pseudomonas cavernicola TaxID=2320866 RepID=A0A418X8F4_9PSED|nr:hypothetical protein [Pseudomonas cavernicola]RJG08653.1 hypothetical protein D3879_22425 [Pseudomonas cavernicola]
MSDLKSDYLEIEEDLHCPELFNRIENARKLYRIFLDLKVKARELSLSEQLSPTDYRERLSKLIKFTDNLYFAFNTYSEDSPDEKKDKQHEWSHVWDSRVGHQMPFIIELIDDDTVNYREDLLEVAAQYLANPWLQHDRIDWILIDSLIFAELAFKRGLILSGEAIRKIKWSHYIFHYLFRVDVKKAFQIKLALALVYFALQYIVPPATIFVLYYLQYEVATIIAGGAYAAYLFIRAFLWSVHYRKRRLEKKTLHDHMNRLQNIADAYYQCKPPIINLTTLRTYLNKAIEAGAVFDGALFTVLKRVEETKGETFIPFTESEEST